METNIRGYGYYSISNDGKVYSNVYKRKVELKQSEHKGYRRVALSTKNKRKIYPVHRLVAEAFVPNPENKSFVNHKDGNKRNNHYTNLEWCTRAENQKHSREVLGNTGLGVKNSHYGYRSAKLYPNEELRNRLVELGVPRYRHNLAELGEIMKSQESITSGWNYAVEEWWVRHSTGTWKESNSGKHIERAKTEAIARAKMVIYLLENNLISLA